MNFKVSLNLPKLMRFKVGVSLGLADGAKLDVRVKLRGGRKWKWTALANPGLVGKSENGHNKTLKKNDVEVEAPLLAQADLDRVRQ